MPSKAPVSATAAWSESPAWASAASAWRPLGGSFIGEGFSLEWHELTENDRVDWARSFHPRSVEVCLNLRGRASVGSGDERLEIADGTAGFYVRGDEPLTGERATGEPHQFLTLELSFDFLRNHLQGQQLGLHPLILRVMGGENRAGGVGRTHPITTRQEELLKSLRDPPVHAVARGVWFRGKALELMSEILFEPDDGELFCTRQKRVARERVEKVLQVLRENMAEPPSLEAIGRKVGCSPYYLSRTFSQETGATIPQYLRRIRMERAAELLRTGRHNVTEVALEVGYNSLSHFSQAFCQTMGSCPAIFQARELKR